MPVTSRRPGRPLSPARRVGRLSGLINSTAPSSIALDELSRTHQAVHEAARHDALQTVGEVRRAVLEEATEEVETATPAMAWNGFSSSIPSQPTVQLGRHQINEIDELYTTYAENNFIQKPTKVKCKECKKQLPLDDTNTIRQANGQYFCDSCFNTQFERCVNCERTRKKTDIVDYEEYRICTSCKKGGTGTCYNCGMKVLSAIHGCINFEIDSLATIGRQRTSCRLCLHELPLHRCGYCGTLVLLLEKHPKCGQRVCKPCKKEHYCEPKRERKVAGAKGDMGKLIDIDRLVGVEVEIEAGRTGNLDTLQHVSKPHMQFHRDGSLKNGVEITTTPSTRQYTEIFVEDVCRLAASTGFSATKTCGLHVHIDARDIENDNKKIAQVVRTFYVIEDILYSMLPPSRWINKYCLPLNRTYILGDLDTNTLEEKWYNYLETWEIDAEKNTKYTTSRYAGCNLHSIFFRGTLELRYHSGTIKPDKILNWIYLLLHIFDWAINKYSESTIQYFFHQETSKDKLAVFLETFDIKPEVQKYITDRINKFNPNFETKFNLGQSVREGENTTRDRSLKLLRGKLEKLKAKTPRTKEDISMIDRIMEKINMLKREGGFSSKNDLEIMVEELRESRSWETISDERSETDI